MCRRFVLYCVRRSKISNFPQDLSVSLSILQAGSPNRGRQGEFFIA